MNGGLRSLRRNTFFPYKDYPADLSLDDCLVERPKPWRIEIMEPLPVSAPGPDQAEPYCCYIQTVKFYKRPMRSTTGGECDLWDECETRLSWEDLVQFESDAFVIGGGSVVWSDGKWWMRRHARRADSRDLREPLPTVAHSLKSPDGEGEDGRRRWNVKLLREFDLAYWQMRSVLGYPIPSRIEARWPKQMNAGNQYKCGRCDARHRYPVANLVVDIRNARRRVGDSDDRRIFDDAIRGALSETEAQGATHGV